jgi:hypothetical protein
MRPSSSETAPWPPWGVDPYGISPLQVSVPRVNAEKPKRNDIDGVIKPYEVWRHQPRTIFLGTSRVNQSMDPSVLDGTRFAPAYNASMPAASMGEHAAYLRQYLRLDSRLHTVIVELFLPNFIGRSPAPTWLAIFLNQVQVTDNRDGITVDGSNGGQGYYINMVVEMTAVVGNRTGFTFTAAAEKLPSWPCWTVSRPPIIMEPAQRPIVRRSCWEIRPSP